MRKPKDLILKADEKWCCNCSSVLLKTNFNKSKSKKDGLSPVCKNCNRKYLQENKETLSVKKKIFNRLHQEEISAYKKEYNKKNKEEIRLYKKRYRQTHAEEIREYERIYKSAYIKKKKKTDIQFRLKHNLRKRFRKAIARDQRSGSSIRDLGCSISELKYILEIQFYPHPETGEMMTWENYGVHGWTMDHIEPLSKFDLSDREQFLQACHFTNLQPMWAYENLAKGDK